jgi:diguanylate cyclase (GGDEF)-like protein/PAS domain S-box-containing protein
MTRLADLKISQKVLLGPGAIVLALAAIVWVALTGTREQELAMQRLQEEVEMPLRQAVDLRDAAAAFQSRAYALISTLATETDTAKVNDEAATLLRRLPVLTSAATALGERLQSIDRGPQNDAILTAFSAYAEEARETVDMLRTMPAYSAIMMNNTERRFVTLRHEIDALVDRMEARRGAITAASVDSMGRARIALIAALMIALTLSVGVALVVGIIIARPITRLTQAMQELAKGDLDVDVTAEVARKDEVGAMASAVQVFKDGLIAARRLQAEQESAREREHARLHKFANATFEGILIHSRGVVLDANEALSNLLGLPDAAELHNCNILDFVAPDSTEMARHWLTDPPPGPDEIEMRRRDGSTVPVEVLARPIEYDGRDAVIVAFRDLSERKKAEDRIRYLAHHDQLTGLANRAFFLEMIEEAGARVRRYGEPFAVFMLDLDRFKSVNDTLGHPAGDALLRAVTKRLNTTLREVDFLARLGGDEFAVIQRGGGNQREAATALARRIIAALGDTYDLDGHQVSIGTSIGIALAPTNGLESQTLMKHADLALYRAKSEGRNDFRFFDNQMIAVADERRQLEADLQHAIARSELEVHYQPIVQLDSQRVDAVEALVRWNHPTQGPIPPARFIPIAEETGLIAALGELVLRKACSDAMAWPEHIKVAINLSPVQFRKSDLFDVVLCALVYAGLPPERLELEITEPVLLESETDHVAMMRKLKNLGVTFSLDDFGTGYSSLSYLTMFQFDKVKIDGMFTRNMTSRADCAAIVSSIVALAEALDIPAVAEGVETREQLKILRNSGVRLAQGYLFGHPGPAAALDFERIYKAETIEHAA